jgi:formylglycine-generating enzyme required for sulfatase activity
MSNYFRYFISLIFFITVFTSENANSLTDNDNSFLSPGQIFRDRLQDGTDGPEMVVVPAGKFHINNLQAKGPPDESPVHTVFVEKFAIGRSEVTFADYDHFATATSREKPEDRGWGRGNRPVIFVSFEDAMAYAAWLTEQSGYEYRLPTEAEWEYVARAGTETPFWWGRKIGKNRAACDGCQSQWGYGTSHEMTAPVCSFPSNPFGLCDTVGNVWEWTCSVYLRHYRDQKNKCIFHNRKLNDSRVIRGGSWFSKPGKVRVSKRDNNLIDDRRAFVGFRLWRRIEVKNEN